MKAFSLLLLIIWLSDCIASANSQFWLAKISLDEATRLILKDGKMRVLSASTQAINGHEVHIIKVLTPDGRVHHYKIDAETGAIIS